MEQLIVIIIIDAILAKFIFILQLLNYVHRQVKSHTIEQIEEILITCK